MIVYPRRGFLNTEFKIRTNEKEYYYIEYNEQIISDGIITPGVVNTLPKFTKAGKYSIVTSKFTLVNGWCDICDGTIN